VALPSGVTVEVKGSELVVKGPKGELRITLLPEVTIAVDAGSAQVHRSSDSDDARARHGLFRALLQNMVVGVSEGFKKQLEIIGVGYKAAVQGKKVVLSLGFSHPVDFAIPEGIEIKQDDKNKNILTISGIDKQLVGQVSSNIRGLRPPEPYKGKGIRYLGEAVRRKPGKAAAAKAGPAAG
jgi:large subunit ribosomal protein L6